MATDQKNMLNFVRLGSPTLTGTTPFNSALVDMQGYDSATFAMATNTVTVAGTSGFALRLQHSDSTAAASFVDVPAAEVIPTSAGATTIAVSADTEDDIGINSLGYRGIRRYVRAVVLGTTNTNAVVTVFAVRGCNTQASAPVPAWTAPTAST